jgi:hypothetical protein
MHESFTVKGQEKMHQTTSITIEHVVVASAQPYEHVIAALDDRLGAPQNWGTLIGQMVPANATWEEVAQTIEAHIGTSGLTLFATIDHRNRGVETAVS